MTRSDQELLDQVRDGDREALAELVERHAPAVYRFAARMCRQPDDAKDVLQETLLSAARGLGEFRGDAALTTWFFAVARSFCIKHRRTSKFAPSETLSLEHSREASQVADRQLAPDEIVAGRELGRGLERAISALDAEQREVLLLRDVEGLSAQEVAEVVGASVGAVKSRLHRARAAVRAALEPGPVVPPPVPTAPTPCPDAVQLFSRHLEGEIGAAECRAMDEHLATCAHCAAVCESLKQTLKLCHAARSDALPSDVEMEVRRALGAITARVSGTSRSAPPSR